MALCEERNIRDLCQPPDNRQCSTHESKAVETFCGVWLSLPEVSSMVQLVLEFDQLNMIFYCNRLLIGDLVVTNLSV